MASSSSSSSPNLSYDVFPSFSGEDVRKTFLSHLLKELDRKSIVAFKDNEMERSHSISPELVEAIRGSRIAVVVFSKNYASSSWCLNELLEILKCKEEFDQMVIPIFYDLDPTHVRKQIGDFGEIFRKTCKNQKDKRKIDLWKKALTDAANLLGYHSKNWGSDAAGIEEISCDISDKLYSTPSNDFEDFVGMKDHITKLTSLLRLESKEVRMVGIWGTSGIGKTTIARALFSHIAGQFQNSVFIDRAFISKSKEAYGRPYLYDHNMKFSLRENFLCELNMKGAIEEKLKYRKVLTIIDDLDDQYVLDALAGQTKWFGSGSRIIVITTNKHLLKAHGIDYIYKVDFPSSGQAREMFCRAAFGQNFPPYGLGWFASEVVQRAGYLPLGLNVMGSSFRGRNKEACLNMLPRLKRTLDGEIEETLRFSYDGLGSEEDKAIFRHIACFFNHTYEVEDIKLFLADSDLDVSVGLDNLFDKSLIYETYGTVEMHRLLEEMGRNIVRKQSINKPGKREFLMDSKDICHVLQKGTGTEKLLGIKLNMDDEIDGLYVHESAFTGIHNLRFLEIHNILRSRVKGELKLHESFNYLPPKLKLLIWPDYPRRCMPSNFCPERLVKLQMQYSNLETLWEGVMSLRCLKEMDLSYSPNLKEIPDLSMATNLEKLKLSYCESLVELPSSIQNLKKLFRLDMNFCTKLEIFPSGINLESLEILDLNDCNMLRTFPAISTKFTDLYINDTSVEEFPFNLYLENLTTLSMGNIEDVQVQEGVQPLTPFLSVLAPSLKNLVLKNIPSLVELPSSFQNLNKLCHLEITDCVNLETLPSTINIKSLFWLDLSGCSRLRSFPNISTNIGNLVLSRTGIEEVPPWINKFSRLWRIYMERCSKLEYVHLNISKLKALKEANFSHCGVLTGVDLCGDASGEAMQEGDISSSSLSDNRSSKVLLNFTYCLHLDHVLLPRKYSVLSEVTKYDLVGFTSLVESFENYLVTKLFRLHYGISQEKYHEVHVDVEFRASSVRGIRFELKNWGIRIAKHYSSADKRPANAKLADTRYCSSVDKQPANANTLPYACEANEDNVVSDSCKDIVTAREDISSLQDQFVNPNTLPRVSDEENVVNDGFHQTGQCEESGGSEVDTQRMFGNIKNVLNILLCISQFLFRIIWKLSLDTFFFFANYRNDSDAGNETDQYEESESSDDSDTGSATDQSEEFESCDDSDSEDISSPQNQVVNTNTLPHFTDEENVVNDGYHETGQREEFGGSSNRKRFVDYLKEHSRNL